MVIIMVAMGNTLSYFLRPHMALLLLVILVALTHGRGRAHHVAR